MVCPMDIGVGAGGIFYSESLVDLQNSRMRDAPY